jgi:MarR family transcriptional regulator, lower aerobic nicotinate degradation pathway regulator
MTPDDRSTHPGSAADPGPADAVVQLSFAVQAILGEIAAENDLSITQLRVLAILRDREPAMLDLARFLNLGKSSVTGLIDRAERRGLVERVTAPGDGRAVHVRLTREGRRLTEEQAARANEALLRLLSPLPARDRARLAALAATVVGRAGQAAATPARAAAGRSRSA